MKLKRKAISIETKYESYQAVDKGDQPKRDCKNLLRIEYLIPLLFIIQGFIKKNCKMTEVLSNYNYRLVSRAPTLRLCIAYLLSPKGGYCSIWDDLSCSSFHAKCINKTIRYNIT